MEHSAILLMLITLKSIPGTYQYLATKRSLLRETMGAFGGWVLEDFIQIQGFNIVQLSIQNFIQEPYEYPVY